MNKIFSSLKYIFFRILITYGIKNLNIEKAGRDDNTCYVKIRNGYIFYGSEARKKDYKYYCLLPKKIRAILPFSCYTIAMDIIIRNIRGGLKLGGPRKEKFYQVKSGDIVAEMGAYRGYYCMYLSKQVGPGGRVIAIEPLESNLHFLKKNIDSNNLTNVTIIPKGVWKKSDTLTFRRSEDDYQSSSIRLNYEEADEFQVKVDSLDTIFREQKLDKIDFTIIQLNGAELEALEGLDTYQPMNMAIAARYSKGEIPVSKLIKRHLEAKHYRVTISARDYVFAKKEAYHP